jgi:hypothetical protein
MIRFPQLDDRNDVPARDFIVFLGSFDVRFKLFQQWSRIPFFFLGNFICGEDVSSQVPLVHKVLLEELPGKANPWDLRFANKRRLPCHWINFIAVKLVLAGHVAKAEWEPLLSGKVEGLSKVISQVHNLVVGHGKNDNKFSRLLDDLEQQEESTSYENLGLME